jgi:uncharacterized Zn-binding protein involved in type VI secretion
MFGSAQFGSDGNSSGPRSGKCVALIGDQSDHGGSLISTNQDGTLNVSGGLVCVEGALHSCPLPFHGITSVSAITIKTYQNGKLILTQGAFAGCGARIIRVDRKVYIE